MESTPATLIIVAAICVILGFLASSLINTLREEGEPISEDNPAPPGGRKGKYLPVVRLWRERSKGTLIVEVDGRSLVDASPLDDSQRERLEAAARDFRAFLGMGRAAGDAPPARGDWQVELGAEGERAAAAPAAPWAASGEELEAGLRRAVGQESAPHSPRPAAPSSKPPATSRLAGDKLSDDAKTPPAGPKSIVLQIEDVLQDMLAGTPLERRDIHLSEDPVRGVIVTVGPHYYEGIEAVPDPEVKSLIKAAVAAWEETQ